jgi:hypothetical protein
MSTSNNNEPIKILKQNSLNNIINDDLNEQKNLSINSTQTSEKLQEKIKKEDNKEEKIVKNKKEKDNFLNYKLLGHKRLIKKSDLILQKELTKKLAKNYFDKEAELGSDNEEHDNVIKKVYNSDSDLEKKEDIGNIEDLIDDKNILNSLDNEEQKEKFITDMFIKDREEVLKVIEGPQRRIINNKIEKKFDESDLPLKLRIERMKNEYFDEEEENEENNFQSLVSRLKKLKKQFKEDNANEDLKAIINSYQNMALKRIEKLNKTNKNELKKRMMEDNKILENVVLLNKKDNQPKDEKKNNNLFIKGNGTNTNNKINHSYKIGSFINSTNSFLRNYQNNQKGNNNNIKKNYEKNVNSNLNSFMIGNLSSLFIKKTSS